MVHSQSSASTSGSAFGPEEVLEVSNIGFHDLYSVHWLFSISTPITSNATGVVCLTAQGVRGNCRVACTSQSDGFRQILTLLFGGSILHVASFADLQPSRSIKSMIR